MQKRNFWRGMRIRVKWYFIGLIASIVISVGASIGFAALFGALTFLGFDIDTSQANLAQSFLLGTVGGLFVFGPAFAFYADEK